VIDLGQGAEMNAAASPFDVGIRWGSPGGSPNSPDYINFPVEFILSNIADNLTLDDIAHVEFGARLNGVKGPLAKITTIAPAAPDAVDDNAPPPRIFEDGAGGLDEPSHDPLGRTGLIEVLANDSDADLNDILTITEAHGAQHGMVTIVDGADADPLPGDAVLYTPDADYSGPDSFVYCISDGNGGQDNATVNLIVEAVADIPDLVFEVVQGALINQIIVNVTATQTDHDGSEYIDRIVAGVVEGGDSDGVTIVPLSVNPANQPDHLVQQFLITVPDDQDTLFNLDITAFSKEVSNDDEEQNTQTLLIDVDFTRNETTQDYVALDQNIWASGGELGFHDDRFIGIDPDPIDAQFGIPLVAEASVTGDVKIGFQSTLDVTLGSIDAHLPFDITIDTVYNKTTDTLLINPTAALGTGASFTTEGPGGSYNLDFIFDYLLEGELTSVLGDVEISFSDTNTFPIVSLDSSDASFDVELPPPPKDPIVTLTFAWPDVDTTSDAAVGNTISSDGTSNNLFNTSIDLDSLVFALLGVPNPFDLGFVEILDADVSAGLNIVQHFDLNALGLNATLTFEDNSTQDLIFGSPLMLSNASSLDGNGDHLIEFDLTLSPNTTLHNETGIGLNFGYNFDLVKIPDLDFALLDLGADATVTSIPVYDETFGLSFPSQQYEFVA
jgi:Bacterial Ig domain